MADQTPSNLLDAYFAGELSPADAERVRAYLEAVPARRGIVAGVLASARSENVDPMPPVETALAELTSRMKAAEHRTPGRRIGRLGLARGGYGWGHGFVAMTIFGCLLAMGGVWYAKSSKPAATALLAQYSTQPGQSAQVTLHDGTRVLLAPSTTLDVGHDFVHLAGEAQFTVRSKTARAFQVRTSNASVTVLGTNFTVRKYPDEHTSRVVVTDGKVDLNNTQGINKRVVLTAHMVGRVMDSTVTATTDVHAADLTAWTQGRLVFREARLGDVVTDLARAYGISIRLTDSVLAEEPVTLTAQPRTQPLPQVLDFVTRSAGAHYVRLGDGFAIEAGKATRHVPRSRQMPAPEKVYGR